MLGHICDRNFEDAQAYICKVSPVSTHSLQLTIVLGITAPSDSVVACTLGRY